LCPPAQSANHETPDSDKLKGRGFVGHFRNQLRLNSISGEWQVDIREIERRVSTYGKLLFAQAA
jgi:hypothetical protein